jgi:hypothetical protein
MRRLSSPKAMTRRSRGKRCRFVRWATCCTPNLVGLEVLSDLTHASPCCGLVDRRQERLAVPYDRRRQRRVLGCDLSFREGLQLCEPMSAGQSLEAVPQTSSPVPFLAVGNQVVEGVHPYCRDMSAAGSVLASRYPGSAVVSNVAIMTRQLGTRSAIGPLFSRYFQHF